jgi:four helix bundle protein
MNLAFELYKLTEKFPARENFGIISQMRRAAVSVPSNIAEGSSRSSEKEKLRFMEFSMGSLNEVETLLLLSNRLGHIGDEEIHCFLNLVSEEQKQLAAFMQKLKAKS